MKLLIPDWHAPDGIKAVMSTKQGGVSVGAYTSCNVGTHVGDDLTHVLHNRHVLQSECELDLPPAWLNQIHSTTVKTYAEVIAGQVDADAVWTDKPGQACVVMTADCLPVLFADQQGGCVAAAHAGWKGLAMGVLEATVLAMPTEPENLIAWIGPAISQPHYEVDATVRDAFMHSAENCFFKASRTGHWLADLAGLAQHKLQNMGVQQIHQAKLCTYANPQQFWSYRRSAISGRQSAMVWLDKKKQ